MADRVMSGVEAERVANGPSSTAACSTQPLLRRLAVALLNLFSNVWWGVSLLVLALVYMSVGSAIPQVRQAFELTEMAWFQTPVMNGLIALFVLSVITVTIRRIRFSLLKLGVWVVHTGLVIMSIGAVLYFSQKIEGDILLIRRDVHISFADGGPSAVLPALADALPVQVAGPGGTWQFRVARIEHTYKPLNQQILAALREQGQPAGQETLYKVDVQVRTPQGRTYIRSVLDGFEAFGEDLVDGARAINTLGRRRVDESLDMRLALSPVSHFYVKDSAALYVQLPQASSATSHANPDERASVSPAPTGDWQIRPLTGRLPYYNEHFDRSWDLVRPRDSDNNRGPLNLPLPDVGPVKLRVLGYLPYAAIGEFFVSRPIDGTATWGDPANTLPSPAGANPVLVLELATGTERLPVTLVANDPARSKLETDEFGIELRRIEGAADMEALAQPGDAKLRVTLRPVRADTPAMSQELRLAELTPPGGAAVGPYRVELLQMLPNYRIISTSHAGETAGMMHVRITDTREPPAVADAATSNEAATTQAAADPKASTQGVGVGGDPATTQPAQSTQPMLARRFSRALILGHPTLTRDLDDDGNLSRVLLNDEVHIDLLSLFPQRWTFVSLPGNQWRVVAREPSGQVRVLDVTGRESVDLPAGGQTATVRLMAAFESARPVPVQLVPFVQREPLRNVHRTRSLLRVELRVQTATGEQVREVWLPHADNFQLLEQVARRPVEIPGYGTVWLLYGRERLPLPNQMALASFDHQRGVGDQTDVDFVSNLAIRPAGPSSGGTSVDSTSAEGVATATGGVAAAERRLSDFVTGEHLRTQLNKPFWDGTYHHFQAFYDPRHLSHSTLLVANRHGMWTMLIGVTLIVLGSMWAFYVKPILQRRIVAAALARSAAQKQHAATAAAQAIATASATLSRSQSPSLEAAK